MASQQRSAHPKPARRRLVKTAAERFWAAIAKRLTERGGQSPEIMFVLGMHKAQKDGAVVWEITVLQGQVDAAECALGHGDRNVCKSAASAAAEYFYTESHGETMSALRSEVFRRAGEGASAAVSVAGSKIIDLIAGLASRRNPR